MEMDPFDEILSDPVVTSRIGSRFQPKIKPCLRKRNLAPQLSTQSHGHDKKATMSVTNSCDKLAENNDNCNRDTTLIKSSSQLSVIDEGSEDVSFLDGVNSKTELEAVALNQSELMSTESTDDINIRVGESVDVFSGLVFLDEFHNQPKNDSGQTQAAISNGDGDMDNQRMEIEEGGVDMDAISTEVAASSGQPARKYRPKSKMKTSKEDGCTQTSKPEISVMLPPSLQVNSCDTGCMHEASGAASKPDGIVNDSLVNCDGYTPVNQHIGEPINVESMLYDSNSDILVDDFNSEDPDGVSRIVSGMSCKEKLSTESNVSQQQERSPQVNEEHENFKSTRKLRKRVSHGLVDEPEAGVNENRVFSDEPSCSNCDLDEDDSNNNQSSREGTSKGKKASKKPSKPSSGNKKPIRKRKEAIEAVSDSQAEKRPKKFSHSTRQSKRQVNKDLLEVPEDEIDFQKISFRDLIIYHEYKEKLEKKDAISRRSTTNQRSDTVGEEGTHDSEQCRGTDDDETHNVVDMTSAYFNYQSFMNKTPRVRWSKQDTQLFYEAVRQFGTDFCMIQQLFPGRTRHQIKLKFKNEERHHPLGLSDALSNRAKDHSHFISVIEQLQEAAKAKHDEYDQNELTENTEEEEAEELSPETNEEVAKPRQKEMDANENGNENENENDKKKFADEVHSPLKSDESDSDGDSCRWDEYKCDF